MKGFIEGELTTVRHMVELYCRGKEHNTFPLTDNHGKEHGAADLCGKNGITADRRGNADNVTLCTDCRDLLVYAERRLDGCRHGDAKPVCRKCPTHCYLPEYRARIREVMRYAGPRLLLHHPLEAVRHLLREIF